MRIAFFSHHSAYEPGNIGGTESYIRRMASEFIAQGHSAACVTYGNINDSTFAAWSIPHYSNTHLNTALTRLKTDFDHVVEIYIPPRDRIRFARYRQAQRNAVKFHFVLFNWADSRLKRFLYFSEPRYFPYNGKLICISKRQYEFVSTWADNAILLLPPVPDNYFPGEKPHASDKIRLVFLGRIDPGKGVNEVLQIFEHLKNDPKLELALYGIHFPADKPSVEIHRKLTGQTTIKYVSVERGQYSPANDDFVRNVLKNTDIFIQPYKKLSSTIDMPLLLLEAMASLCAVITKPFGNIPDIYGDSPFLISERNFVPSALQLLVNVDTAAIAKERERILERNNALSFRAEAVAVKFLQEIND